MSAKRVLLADDSPLARRAVRALLRGEAGFEVVGEAGDGAEALALTRWTWASAFWRCWRWRCWRWRCCVSAEP